MLHSALHALFGLALLLLAPPLLLGVIGRTKAAFAGRQGPPWIQPYRELARLWHKGSVFSTTTTLVFRLGPIVGLGAVLLAAQFVPLGGHPALLAFEGDLFAVVYLLALARFALALAALDTGSAFEGMGAAREVTFGALAEPALLFGFLILARLSGAWTLSEMMAPELWHHWTHAGAAPLVLVAVSWFIVLLAENARIPFDDPQTHLELTMVHEVMVLDHSGPLLAIVQYAAALKLFVYAALLQRVVLPASGEGPAYNWLIFVVSLLAIAVLVGVVESVTARLRMLTVPKLLVAAALSAAFGVLLLTRG